MLVDGIYPHAGRRFTEAEKLRAKNGSIWTRHLPHQRDPARGGRQRNRRRCWCGSTANIRGPDTPDQSLDGEYRLLVPTRMERSRFTYDHARIHASGTLLEAGLSTRAAQPAASEFRWIGQGPYAGYPGKDALNEFGLYHLSRADIRFQGNRRETDVALLTNSRGQGVLLQGERP